MNLRPQIIGFTPMPGVACPGTAHLTEISAGAALHYHRTLTEICYFLECQPDAKMQLDNEVIDVKPGMCVLIPPGVRHRAIGRMKVLDIVFSKFDPAGEWMDE
jgi:quercetin dioxygenase-like cupin family protein